MYNCYNIIKLVYSFKEMNCNKIEDEDYYKSLKILPNSTDAEIKKAYRKKALQLHPDKNPNNPHAVKQFQKLLNILETLTNKSKRREYDRQLELKKAEKKSSAVNHKTTRQSRQNLEGIMNLAEIRWFHTIVSITVMTVVILNIFCDHKIKL